MNGLIRRFRRLADDEAGTSMTEFAITLPVFLAFFALIGGLGNSVQGAIDAQTRAAPDFWEEVYAAEDDAWRMSARTEAFTRSNNAQDIIQNLRGGWQGGHWQESHHAVNDQMGIITGQDIPNNADDDPARHLTDDPDDIIGDSRAAQGVSDDSLISGGGILSNPGGIRGGGIADALFDEAVRRLTQALGMHLGFGAGVRYGDVSGGAVTTVDPGYQLPEFEHAASYSSRVSPSPDIPDSIPFLDRFLGDPETRAFATARIYVQPEEPYGQLFNILGDDACTSFYCSGNRLNPSKSNAVPVIYDDHGSNPQGFWSQVGGAIGGLW